MLILLRQWRFRRHEQPRGRRALRFVALPGAFAILTASAAAYTSVAIDRITDRREQERRCSDALVVMRSELNHLTSQSISGLQAGWPRGSSAIRGVQAACSDALAAHTDTANELSRWAKVYSIEGASVAAGQYPGYILGKLSDWTDRMLHDASSAPPLRFVP